MQTFFHDGRRIARGVTSPRIRYTRTHPLHKSTTPWWIYVLLLCCFLQHTFLFYYLAFSACSSIRHCYLEADHHPPPSAISTQEKVSLVSGISFSFVFGWLMRIQSILHVMLCVCDCVVTFQIKNPNLDPRSDATRIAIQAQAKGLASLIESQRRV